MLGSIKSHCCHKAQQRSALRLDVRNAHGWLNHMKWFLLLDPFKDLGLLLEFGKRLVNCSHSAFLFSSDIPLSKSPFTDQLFLISLDYWHHPLQKVDRSFLQRHFRLRRISSKHLGHKEDPDWWISWDSSYSQRSEVPGEGLQEIQPLKSKLHLCYRSPVWQLEHVVP